MCLSSYIVYVLAYHQVLFNGSCGMKGYFYANPHDVRILQKAVSLWVWRKEDWRSITGWLVAQISYRNLWFIHTHTQTHTNTCAHTFIWTKEQISLMNTIWNYEMTRTVSFVPRVWLILIEKDEYFFVIACYKT